MGDTPPSGAEHSSPSIVIPSVLPYPVIPSAVEGSLDKGNALNVLSFSFCAKEKN